jgi:hypothetical protein
MSQRFVKGYKLDAEKMDAFLGSKELSYEVLKKANKDYFDDIEETLEEDGMSLKALLSELNQNELNSKHAYGYSRILELILNSGKCVLDEQIDLIVTNFLNTESGDWNEVLKEVGLIHLSELWATNNFAFPWKKSKPKSDWPIWTLIKPEDVDMLLREFKNFNEKKLNKVDDEFFDNNDEENQKEELIAGLNILKDWLVRAKKEDKNEVILLQMDGDQ